jgi:hypothetical protein
MANFDPVTARITTLFMRRRDPFASGNRSELGPAGGGYVLDELKFYKIRYNVDVPGDSIQMFEPISDGNFSVFTNAGSLDLFGMWAPTEGVETLDNPYEVMRID